MTVVGKRGISKTVLGIVLIAIVVVAASTVYIFLARPAPSAVSQIRLITSAQTVSAAIAEFQDLKNGGYLAAVGLNATVQGTSGSPDTVKALLTGSGDIGYIGQDSLVSAVAGGASIAAFMAWGNAVPMMIITDKSINTWNDMIGKRIGIAAIAGLAYQIWNGVLKKQGLFDKVNFVRAGVDNVAIMKALLAGSVDAAVEPPENWALVANSSASANLHVFLPSVVTYFPFLGYHAIVATKAYMQNHPEIIQKVTTALLRMTRDFDADKSRWVEVSSPVGDYTKLQLLQTWELLKQMNFFTINGGINLDKLNQLIGYVYKDLNPSLANNTYVRGPKSLVDTTFLGNALTQLGVMNAPWDVPDWYSSGTARQAISFFNQLFIKDTTFLRRTTYSSNPRHAIDNVVLVDEMIGNSSAA